MKTLYISDLDGTLLNGEAELSEYTVQTINTLIKQGIHFTTATARTAATVANILKPLDVNTPVVLMNGALIYDMAAMKYLKIHYFTKDAFRAVTDVLKEFRLTGFLYEVRDNTLNTYYEHLASDYMREFYEERVRKYRKPFKQVSDFSLLNPEHMVYFSILNKKETIEPAYRLLKEIPGIAMAFYKDIYSEEDTWYLEIFSDKATKYNAVQYLRTRYQYDYVIGFGDNLNDLPLFKACDETCAVANAKEEVKTEATHLIESNQKDGVARWLKDHAVQHTYFYQTVLGRIGITENGTAITSVFYCRSDETEDIPDTIIEETPLLKEAVGQLEEYFCGKRETFTLSLAPMGTPFQRRVWEALRTIPYGETRSYKQIAEYVGNPKASRAVGMANNRNPIAIMIPCHRVIGAGGSLVGYAGGLTIKQQLLYIENIKKKYSSYPEG